MADLNDRTLFSRMTLGAFDSAPVESVDISKYQDETPESVDGDVELGSTGLKRSGGNLYDEWLRQLQGQKGIRTFREMADNNPTVGATLYTIESLILQAPWHVEAAASDPTPEQIEVAEFLRGALFDDMTHTWQSFLSEALSCVTYGWSFFEVVYKIREGDASRYDDRRVGWAKWAPRGQETLDRWAFDDVGDTLGMHQSDYSTGRTAFIPLAKALLFTFRSHLNSPEGRSGLRSAYRPWYFLKKMQEIEAIGMERDLAGLPVIEAPVAIMSSTATAVQRVIRAGLFKIVKSIRMDSQMGVVMPSETGDDGKPSGYKLRLLSTGGKRASDIGAAIDRYSKEVAMTLLTQFLFLGMDRTGSFALADSSTDIFAVALGATMDRITDTVNRHAIPPLMKLNGIPESDWPRLVHGDVESRDLSKLADFVVKLSAVGAMSTEDLEPYLREIANLPKRGESANVEDVRRPSITMPLPPTQSNGNAPTEDQP